MVHVKKREHIIRYPFWKEWLQQRQQKHFYLRGTWVPSGWKLELKYLSRSIISVASHCLFSVTGGACGCGGGASSEMMRVLRC